jgi:hypothetical protein
MSDSRNFTVLLKGYQNKNHVDTLKSTYALRSMGRWIYSEYKDPHYMQQSSRKIHEGKLNNYDYRKHKLISDSGLFFKAHIMVIHSRSNTAPMLK